MYVCISMCVLHVDYTCIYMYMCVVCVCVCCACVVRVFILLRVYCSIHAIVCKKNNIL